MGNCLFGGLGEVGGEVIKVVTSNGGVMEFYAPLTVESITNEFPGHGIFRNHDLFWKPLPLHDELLAGESYYLLPLDVASDGGGGRSLLGGQIVRQGHIRSNSLATSSSSEVAAPYRMSFDNQRMLKRSYTEAFSRSYGGNTGFWKVKLVISTEQLLEILSQDGPTQELIESVRTVAKCGTNGVSSMGFSDQWSLSSSRNASSKNEGLLES